MRYCIVLGACALLLACNAEAYSSRRGRKFRLGARSQGMLRFKSGRRHAELTVDQNDLRALCESRITPGVSGRRVMETTFGGRAAAFLEGEGIDRRLLCQSKLYEEVKRDEMHEKHETMGTAMVSKEDNVHKLVEESNRGPSPDKKQEFNVEAAVVFKGDEDNVRQSADVQGSAEGLSGTGFKSKSRSFMTLHNRRKAKPLMEMDHFKETDFEVDL